MGTIVLAMPYGEEACAWDDDDDVATNCITGFVVQFLPFNKQNVIVPFNWIKVFLTRTNPADGLVLIIRPHVTHYSTFDETFYQLLARAG